MAAVAAWSENRGTARCVRYREAGAARCLASELLRAQSGDGINAAGATRGKPTGEERDDSENEGNRKQGRQVHRGDAVEQARDRFAEGESARGADDHRNSDEHRTMADDHAEHVETLRAK